MTTDPTANVIAAAKPWLVQCGICDFGIGRPCVCPEGDYRPVIANLVAELERVTAERDQAAQHERDRTVAYLREFIGSISARDIEQGKHLENWKPLRVPGQPVTAWDLLGAAETAPAAVPGSSTRAQGPDADRIAQAIGDPGSIVGRRRGPSWGEGNDGYAPEYESVTRWATRAVLAVLAAVQPPAADTPTPTQRVLDAARVWREARSIAVRYGAADALAAAVDALDTTPATPAPLPEQCDDCETTGYNCYLHAAWAEADEAAGTDGATR